LLQKMTDRISESVKWSAQILFLETGAVLPLTVTFESVKQLPHFPSSSKYNPRVMLSLTPMYDRCIRFPKQGEFRLMVSAEHGNIDFSTVYDQFVSMAQLRAQASIFLERRTDCMILEKSNSGSCETKFSFVASDREINELHLQNVTMDLAIADLQRQLQRASVMHEA